VFDQIADQLNAQRRFVQEVNLPQRGVIRLDGGRQCNANGMINNINELAA
jgi:hypothetical protein